MSLWDPSMLPCVFASQRVLWIGQYIRVESRFHVQHQLFAPVGDFFAKVATAAMEIEIEQVGMVDV